VTVSAEPNIVSLPGKHLIGMSRRMSLAADATPLLWRSFMPRRNEVPGRIDDQFISLRTFTNQGSDPFDVHAEFEKYALVEVHPGGPVPQGMQRFELAAGEYAVFRHRGPASAAPQTFGYIFTQWLPASPYEFDPRPQFEVLGAAGQTQ